MLLTYEAGSAVGALSVALHVTSILPPVLCPIWVRTHLYSDSLYGHTKHHLKPS